MASWRAAGCCGQSPPWSHSGLPPLSQSQRSHRTVRHVCGKCSRIRALFSHAPHPALRFWPLFVRFASRRMKLWDSLTTNAYGIYLLHYGFVIWLQYALLKATLPAISKGPLVLLGAVLLSWGMTTAIRRIPAIAHVI